METGDLEISVEELQKRRNEGEAVTVLDIRKPAERKAAVLEDDLFVPLGELPGHVEELREQERPLVVYCHHGLRSLRATKYLRDEGLEEVFSLAGGIDAWSNKIDPDVPTY